MKKFLLLALSIGAVFACNKQTGMDDGVIEGPEKTVTLSIQQEAMTKGVSDQMGATEYSVIGSARIYFLDNSNVNIGQRDLTAAEIAALANTTTTPGNKTVTMTGVPSNTTTLYMVANVRTSEHPAFVDIEGALADARLRIDKLQANRVNVPMAGQSTVFQNVTGNNFTTNVTIKPLVSRFELAQISCQNQNGASAPAVNADITNYKLTGVFMNNVREFVTLGGLPYVANSPIDIRSQSGWAGGWPSYFTPANTLFPYWVGGSPAAPVDWVVNSMSTYCTPASVGMTFYPDATLGSTSTTPTVTPAQVWGYQIVPSTTVAVGSPADVPHLILKLENVTYVDDPLAPTTLYVTVTKYKKMDGTPVTAFERGNVYRISNLIFTHNEATEQPYQTNITVTATVTVSPWVINEIQPDWL